MRRRREEIEEIWQGREGLSGAQLCIFLSRYSSIDIELIWNDIWKRQNRTFIRDYFRRSDHTNELTYLCRALTLNMLLDDNEELLD